MASRGFWPPRARGGLVHCLGQLSLWDRPGLLPARQGSGWGLWEMGGQGPRDGSVSHSSCVGGRLSCLGAAEHLSSGKASGSARRAGLPRAWGGESGPPS